MLTFLIRRLVFSCAIFLALSVIVWWLCTPEGALVFTHIGGFTFFKQNYEAWMTQIVHGNFGVSNRTFIPVVRLFQEGLLPSLLVLLPAFILQEILAIPLGLFAGVHAGSPFDRFYSNASYILTAIPGFWLSMIAISIVCVQLHWLPFQGVTNIAQAGTDFGTPLYWSYFHTHTLEASIDIVRHIALPILIIALLGAASDGQYVRWSMMEVMEQEYITMARARGLPQRLIVWRHGLRNALLPLITNLGLQLPRLVLSAGILEFTFGIPGFGGRFISAIYSQPNDNGGAIALDLPVVAAYFLLIGVLTLVASFATDIAYAAADPRIRVNS